MSDGEAWTYLALLAVSGAISLAIAGLTLRRRAIESARLFGLVALLEACWTLGHALEFASQDLATKIFWDDVQWLFTLGIPPALMGFALRFTGTRLGHGRPLSAAIWGTTVLFAVFLASHPLHGMTRIDPRLAGEPPFQELDYELSPPVLVIGVVLLGYVVAAFAIFLSSFVRAQPLYRRQAWIVLAGVSFPAIGGVAILLGFHLGPQRDTFPLTFAISNVVISYGLFRYRLFDVIPLAREAVIENLADAVIVLDDERRVVDLNPAARRLLAPGNGGGVGRPAGELAEGSPALRELLESRESDFAEREIEGPLGSRPSGDGEGAAVAASDACHEARSFPLRDAPGSALLGRVVTLRDVTARKRAERELEAHRRDLEELVSRRTAELSSANERLRREMEEHAAAEEKLRQSQKMEAMGRLAGGVAHDLNNLLVPILGYTEMAMGALDPREKIFRDLSQVREAANRAADLTRQILAFSRHQVLQLRPADLNEIVADMQKMIGRIIGEDVRLSSRLAPSPCRILADRSQIDQILMNLAVNARDAMPRGGRLTIATEIEPPEASDGVERVALLVEDEGEGMDEATLARIFEPFFTTKGPGRGTGLGLATVLGIVQQHGGSIDARSAPGRGTTFRVRFPRTHEEAPPAPREDSRPEVVAGSGRVLLVEDDRMVRSLVGKILRSGGYEPIAAASPLEAIGLARSCGELRLILTDLVMPEMNGLELRDRLVETHPEARVLFMSGYTDDAIMARGLPPTEENFLSKPFTPRELLEKVREVLEAR